ILIEDDNEGLTNKEKNPKKDSSGNLTDTYLKVLKNQISEPTKPKEPLINLKELLKIEPSRDDSKVEQVDDEKLEVNNKRKNNHKLWFKDKISYMEEMNEDNQQIINHAEEIQVGIDNHKEPNPNQRPAIKDHFKDLEIVHSNKTSQPRIGVEIYERTETADNLEST
ncbi:20471_t:CDS:2, partial [Gigaspora rosea]